MGRAVEDQLRFTHTRAASMGLTAAAGESVPSHLRLRELAAAQILAHAEEFCPFLGLPVPSQHSSEQTAPGQQQEEAKQALEAYCARVASPVLAEWGGQLEVRALAGALGRPIHVYSADAPLLRMEPLGTPGTFVEGLAENSPSPLRLTYHKHYYALGEHYNSVTGIGTAPSSTSSSLSSDLQALSV